MNILTRSLRIGMCASLGLFFAAEAQAQTVWNGSVSSSYTLPANWTPAAVPTATDDVSIPVTARPPVVGGVGRARNITVAANTSLTVAVNGILNVSASIVNNGTIADQAGGLINLTGSLTNNSTFGGDGELATVGAAVQTITSANLINLGNLNIGAAGASLLSPMNLTRRLLLTGSLTTNAGNTLTLISTPDVTAFVVNNGGVVTGNVTVQRAIDGSINTNLGYRHYSSPVAATTIADLATVVGTPFSPEVSAGAAYNSSTFPRATVPFPTVFNYDQARVMNASINYGTGPNIDRGFQVPDPTLGVNAPLEVGRGYAVNIASGSLVDFVGTLNNGTYTRNVTRNAVGTVDYASSGWQLFGNPYPSGLDFSALVPPPVVTPGTPAPTTNLVNIDPVIYVVQSTSQYGNMYRSYSSSTNLVNPTLPLGQGFFMHVTDNQVAGSITFQNTQRLTSSDGTTFQRTNTITHPQVELSLTGAAMPSMTDLAIVYLDNATTGTMDSQYDAYKLPNSTGLNLSTLTTTGQSLSIDGRPVTTGTLTVPLQVFVPATGTYTLQASALRNMSGYYTYLRDIQTGTMTDLAQQASYTFSLNATNTTPRFELVISARALATVSSTLTQQVSLYPSPAKDVAYLELPASLGSQALTATFVDAVGRTARTTSLPAQGSTAHALSLSGLTPGVYAVQLRTSAGLVVKRLVIQ